MEKSFKIGDLVRVSDDWFEREQVYLDFVRLKDRPRLPFAEDIGIILFFHEMPEEPYDNPDFPYEADGVEIHWFRKDIVCLSDGGWLTDDLSIVVKSLSS